MSRRGHSVRNQPQRGGQIARIEQIDPFRHMHQMMMGFGGLENDPIFGSMMRFGFGRDPFEQMFKFSDIHKGLHERGTEGSYVMQSFISSSKIGPDGKIVQQNYFENNTGEHRGGNTISQKQQAYKNNQGINRIAQQRMLNDKGRKIVRQKIGSNIEETNHYYNIDEQQAQQFDNEWRQADHNMGFLKNHQRYIQQIDQPRQMQLGYEPQIRVQQPQYTEARRPEQIVYLSPNSRVNRVQRAERLQPVQYQPTQISYSGNSRISRPNELPTNSNIQYRRL